MISFNLTALTQPTPSIQRKSKTRNFLLRKTFQNLPETHSYFQLSFYPVASAYEYLQETRR